MAELKILGEKRVKALLEVLDAKLRGRKAALNLPTEDDLKRIADAEFGISDKREEVEVLKDRLKSICEELNDVTGEVEYVTTSYSHRRNAGTTYRQRLDELRKSLQKDPVDTLEREFAEKRTQLWLCETLEQAKAIVGIT